MLFLTPGTCNVESQIFFLTAQLQMSKVKSLQFLETIPPFLFIHIRYCIFIQSQEYMNWISDLFLRNDFKQKSCKPLK